MTEESKSARSSSTPPSPHVHKCERGSDDGGHYCASRGYCECQCGARLYTGNRSWHEGTPTQIYDGGNVPSEPPPPSTPPEMRNMTKEERQEFNEMAGYNDLPKLSAPPASPETPAELMEALDEIERGAADPTMRGVEIIRAARSALLALYAKMQAKAEGR